MRTIVDLPADQVAALAELCRNKGISRAEAVRRALAAMLAQQRETGRERAFGAWRKGTADGRQIVERLRDEWSQ